MSYQHYQSKSKSYNRTQQQQLKQRQQLQRLLDTILILSQDSFTSNQQHQTNKK